MAELKTYKFIGFNDSNVRIVGEVKAEDLRQAKQKASQKALLLEIVEKPKGNPKKLGAKDLYYFSISLSTFLAAGYPMIEALGYMKERMPRHKVLMDHLASYISAGVAVSNAMELTEAFPRLYVNQVLAGENSGSFDKVLEELGEYYQSIIGLQGQIRGALMYPVMVFITTVAVLMGYLIMVVPTMEDMYGDLGSQLPSITVVTLNIATWLRSNWIVFLLSATVIVLVLRMIVRDVKPVRKAYEQLITKIPVVNKAKTTPEYIRFAKTFATAYQNGLPPIEVLQLSKSVVSSVTMQEKLDYVIEDVLAGRSLAESFKKQQFDPMFYRAIAIGENTGQLGNALNRYLQMVERDFANWTKTASTMLEPITLLIVAGGVGFMVVSLYLPMFRLIPTMMKGF